MSKNLNRNMHKAKSAKNDEFYTRLTDIERELIHYRHHFKDKVVYCNCDDPRESNFFHYFSYNFEFLGLKKLIATCYKSSETGEQAVYLEYNGDQNGNLVPDMEEINVIPLRGDGDFRSEESIELLKQADIVVTNPPFSLFREFIAQLVEFDKKFLILGNQNSINCTNIFPLFKNNKIWYGHNIGGMSFRVPDSYDGKVDESGQKWKSLGNTCWYTNLDNSKRHEDLILYRSYSPEEYPKYDNYDAINVNKTTDIPEDYAGVMGVPISFMSKYNPDQFEILGMTSGRDEFECRPTKRYVNAIQHNPNGTTSNGSSVNTSATLMLDSTPDKVYYRADNADGPLVKMYRRILIRNKKLLKA